MRSGFQQILNAQQVRNANRGRARGGPPGGGTLVDFRVLGAVELWVEGERQDLGSGKERCALAVLLLSAGRTVSVNTVVTCVWGDEPSPKARENLHAYISRLRRRLREAGADQASLITAPNQGYRLEVPAERIDVNRFRRLAREADAAAGDEPALAAGLLREALALFDSEPLAGLTGEWAEATRYSLLEQRRAAVLKRAGLELRLGHHDQLIGELTPLTSRGPLDQKVVGLLMTALYNAGRLSESLVLYRETSRRLRRELGIDPGHELRALHQRILKGDPLLQPAQPQPARTQLTATTAPPDTLDRDPPHFTGRAGEVRELSDAVHEDLRAGSSSLHVIAGMPGVGKTTLALHVAHRLRESFPDGALQLNLRSHDLHHGAMEPGEALVTLLGMIGVQTSEAGQLASAEACAALWRARTANRRMLILLDDAQDAEQIRRLIPVGAGSLVLITSRTRITQLEAARTRSLDSMDSADAAALFHRFAGAGRIDAPELLAKLTRLCGELPLAIAVAAGYFRSHASWRVGDLVERVADAWKEPDDGDELTRPVRIAFDLSYRALSQTQQRLFRRLGLHPGDQISLHAAAMLLGGSRSETMRALDALMRHNLVEEPDRHRYRMHDLLRGYAAQRAQQEEDERTRGEAVGRLLDFYLFVADAAAHALQPHDRKPDADSARPAGDLPRVDTLALAQAWFSAEYVNALKVVRYCLEHRWFEHAGRIPQPLSVFLHGQGRWHEAIEVHEHALQAWLTLGDRAGQAAALTGLAESYWRLGRLDSALGCAQAALDLRRQAGDAAGEADALLQLSRIHWQARRRAAAEESLRAGAALWERLGDRRGLALATRQLGLLTVEFGSPALAVPNFEEALRIAREIGDRSLERDSLNNLAVARQMLGRLPEAMEHYQLALAITREIGSRQSLAILANNIGELHGRLGDHQAALDSFRSARDTFQEVGDVRNEIETLLNAAEPYLRLQRSSQALIDLQRALLLVRQIDDPVLHVRVEHAFGDVYRQQVRYPEALQAYRSALARARRAAAPAEQARALRRIGDILTLTRGPAAARRHWLRALELFEQVGLPEAEELRKLLRETGTQP